MPRGKSYLRSEAAKKRNVDQLTLRVGHAQPSATFCGQRGTGLRHKVRRWPVSVYTGRSHKLVIPEGTPDKKFVLLVGDSHLRAVADGIVKMPGEKLSFGIMATPGADANQLRTEVSHAVIPLVPDAVCIMAPSNNLTASRTVDEAGQAFSQYLRTACERWPKVFVMDFVPRLTVSGEYQELMRQEFHRQSVRLGVKYWHMADHFPLGRRELWCPDGIHLSDNVGMPILVQLLWGAAYQQLETPAPVPPVQRQVSPKPSVPRIAPRVVVKGEVPATRPPPSEWTLVESGRKRNHSGEAGPAPASPKRRVVPRQADGTPVALRECFIPLNPVRFSTSILAAVDKSFPSALGDFPTGKQPLPEEPHRRSAVIKQKRVRQQVCNVSNAYYLWYNTCSSRHAKVSLLMGVFMFIFLADTSNRRSGGKG
ncbi:uncharacterized protein LOC121645682 isoform X2 [Melanotaenia boesemani]|nr:uncharacterized protein LOC121645682 isoform X2 [Melanotaenia boesemani]